MDNEADERDELLFLSHNLLTQIRNRFFLSYLTKVYRVLVPGSPSYLSSMLKLRWESMGRLLRVGLAGLETKIPKHVEDTDILISPFWKRGRYLLDYHCPVDVELRWLGMDSLAILSRLLMPRAIQQAVVVLAANHRMLKYASRQGRIRRGYVIPDFPLSKSKLNISSESARKKLGIAEDAPMALFVGAGRLREIYGIELLIKSWLVASKRIPRSQLFIVGNTEGIGLDQETVERLGDRGLHLIGRVPHKEVFYWIAASDVCLSQRTPGFPSEFYDRYDSLKISEYALYQKPIVVAGYSDCPDYLSAKRTVKSYSEAIVAAFKGGAPVPIPHTWEENIPVLKEAYSYLF